MIWVVACVSLLAGMLGLAVACGMAVQVNELQQEIRRLQAQLALLTTELHARDGGLPWVGLN